ncbi:uncharacterized protein LOC115923269 [Strongylocentrotus purpuratus]|uniref:Endonuclease/exonuclease/phosphatase domain-containing protein n=1 Tax=Strongylocentrotus purpuratus TaxID=7668 RepID=A0A7M7SXY9_STRPU|nr:uncharacterized protein LOC115923269 [Strongylocentrotus purpuratus]
MVPHSNSFTNFAIWNARSVKARGKSTAICDFVISKQLHFFAVTETWLTNSDRDNRALADIRTTLPNFEFHHSPRLSGKGGGVGVLLHKGFKVSVNREFTFKSFEHIDLMLRSSGSTDLRLVVIYRPPSSARKRETLSTFFNELSTLVEVLCINHQRLLIVGDFNVHVDDPNNVDAQRFLSLLDVANLHNHIKSPTHSSGHTLDLVISRDSDDLVLTSSTDSSLPSDHRSAICGLSFARPLPVKRTVVLRKCKDIDQQDFQKDIQKSQLFTDSLDECGDLADLYNEEMQRLLDQHAPLEEKEFILRPQAPWYSDALRRSKQERRRAERAVYKSGLQIHKDIYKEKCKSYLFLLRQTKEDYFLKKIDYRDQRGLYRMVRTLSSPHASSQILPCHDSPGQLAESFCSFFDEKVKRIRQELDASISEDLSVPVKDRCSSYLTEFHTVSEDELVNIVKGTSNSYCDLDPIPTSLLKKVISQ